MSDFPNKPVRLHLSVTPEQYRELEHARYIWFNRYGVGERMPRMHDFVSMLLTRLTVDFIYEMCAENKNNGGNENEN